MKKIISFALYTCILTLSSINLRSQNLLTNGDFESGGSGVGFTTNYTVYTPPGGGTNPGDYAISNNPTPLNPFFISPLVDHTSGMGNLMVLDGSTNANTSFWSAGNGPMGLCGLTVGATYEFSYWIRSISTTTINIATQPEIEVRFTNVTSNTRLFGNPTVETFQTGWQQVVYSFVPNNACVNINLVDLNNNPAGNDFAIDDMSVRLQLCPLTILSITNPAAACAPSTVDITATAVTAGSIGGGMLTYWTDSMATIPLTNPATISMSGTYYIRSTSGPTCTDIKPVLVTIKPVITPTFNPFPANVCPGSPVPILPTLSNNGIVGTWNPATVNNTDNTTPNYTFTPDTSNTPNLVVNGDFSQGNTGFTSDYNFLPTSDGTVRGVYGVTTNSIAWFNSLANCADHTTGAGNFLVADSSVSNGGNDNVWCQTIPVVAGENYIFNFFSQSVDPSSPAILEVKINGVSIGTNNLSNTTCNWTPSSFPWNSGTSTSAVICINNRSTTAFGNDFGIDDISFTPSTRQCANPLTITINVNSTTVPMAIDQSFCSNSNPLPTLSSLVVTGVTGTLNWYNSAIGGTPIPATTNLVNGTTYYVTQTLNGCESARTAILVNLTVTPPPNGTNPNQNFCTNNAPTVASLVAVGTDPTSTFNWYNMATGGMPLATTTLLINGTYYVTQVINNCESTRVPITVTITDSPVPSAPNQSFCVNANATVANLMANGSPVGTFNWYSSMTGGTPLPTTDPLASGTYYVSQTINTCESLRFAIMVTILTTPEPLAAANQDICQNLNPTLANLIVTPLGTGTLNWYDVMTNGTPIPNTTILVDGTTYYVSETVNGCESRRVPITVRLITTPPPTPPLLTPFCASTKPTVRDLSTSFGMAGTYNFYSMATGSPILTLDIPLATGTYYVSQVVNNCESDKTPFQVTVDNTPVPMANAQTFCETENATIANLVATGTDIKWYNVAGTLLTPMTLLANGTYYASQTIANCESSQVPVVVTINPAAKPIFTLKSSYCQDDIPDLLNIMSTNGITGTWNPAIIDTTTLGTVKYTFTPGPNQCASIFEIDITILDVTIAPFTISVSEPFAQNTFAQVIINTPSDYLFQLDNGLSQESPFFYNITPGEHSITVTRKNGCGILAEVFYIIDYPKFFTPNNDGYNDSWGIVSDENLVKINSIYIFDKLGKFLKQLGPNQFWDGNYTGNQLPSTDYWFSINYIYNNKNSEFKSHFTMKR